MSETNAELENALKGLAPAPAAIDRDRLMFLAGQAGSRRALLWKLTSGMFAAASLALALILLLRPPAEIRTVHVVVPGPSPREIPESKPQENPFTNTEPVPALTPDNTLPDLAYYRLQQQIMRFGVDGIPALSHPGPPIYDPPVTVDRLGKMSPSSAGLNFFGQ